MSALTDILRLAGQQDHVVARHQARQLGLAVDTFDKTMQRAGAARLAAGVWLVPGAAYDARARVRAAVLAVPEPHLITGHASLWLCKVLEVAPRTVDVLVPNGATFVGAPMVRVCQTRAFDDIPSRRTQGVRTANVSRSIADYASAADVEQLIVAIAHAARLRRCQPEDVAAEIQRRARFPGRPVLRRAVGLVTGELSHSGEERFARTLLGGARLAFHPRPYPVDVDGRTIAEIDLARPDIRYGVEVDGPPHLLPEQAARDRARDRRLVHHDWVIDRYLWTQVRSDPRGFVTEVTAAIAARRRNLTDRGLG